MKPINQLTFTDNFMFNNVMQDTEICKGMIERFLKIKTSGLNILNFKK